MSGADVASAAQARGLDAAAGELGVSTAALMALAGFQAARLVDSVLGGGAPVVVLAGPGNNGADALDCARHLALWGYPVRALTLVTAAAMSPVYAAEASAARASGVALGEAGDAPGEAVVRALTGAALAVDGLLGTGSHGAPRAAIADAIERLSRASLPVLAVDLPSGLDADTGAHPGACIRASQTLMLAAAKRGCLEEQARAQVGELWLADIGVPGEAYGRAGLRPPLFGPQGLGPYPGPARG